MLLASLPSLTCLLLLNSAVSSIPVVSGVITVSLHSSLSPGMHIFRQTYWTIQYIKQNFSLYKILNIEQGNCENFSIRKIELQWLHLCLFDNFNVTRPTHTRPCLKSFNIYLVLRLFIYLCAKRPLPRPPGNIGNLPSHRNTEASVPNGQNFCRTIR
jgi:hypothetical protein